MQIYEYANIQLYRYTESSNEEGLLALMPPAPLCLRQTELTGYWSCFHFGKDKYFNNSIVLLSLNSVGSLFQEHPRKQKTLQERKTLTDISQFWTVTLVMGIDWKCPKWPSNSRLAVTHWLSLLKAFKVKYQCFGLKLVWEKCRSLSAVPSPVFSHQATAGVRSVFLEHPTTSSATLQPPPIASGIFSSPFVCVDTTLPREEG